MGRGPRRVAGVAYLLFFIGNPPSPLRGPLPPKGEFVLGPELTIPPLEGVRRSRGEDLFLWINRFPTVYVDGCIAETAGAGKITTGCAGKGRT